MKEELIKKAYDVAVERYAAVGVDANKALEDLQKISLSLHCWQADDVAGFESNGSLSGGIQATGNYPGKARNIEEVRQDILKAASYIPGTHRLNLHEIYGDFGGQFVDRDQVEPKHFESWIQWGAEHGMKLDFNSTSFSHPKSGNLSLSNPDKEIRDFWIEHTKRCRAIAEEMGKRQGDPCIMNLWVHDGSKDITVNRLRYRELLKDSLDQIFAIAGIQKGQYEAPKSLGMTKGQTLIHVILPQAALTAVPALANSFISLLKDTSLCSILTVQEIFYGCKTDFSNSVSAASALHRSCNCIFDL